MFALTMSGDDDKMDAKLQGMRTDLDGLKDDIKTLHEKVDSSISSSNERLGQQDLAQIAAKCTFDTLTARLDAMNTTLTTMRMETAALVPAVWYVIRLMIHLLRLNLRFLLLMANMILLHILIGS